MSRQRTVKIKRGSKIYTQNRNNNVLILKVADPLVQVFIFIYFLYCLNAEVLEPSYRTVLLMLVAWQMCSAVLNFFYKDPKAQKVQRMIYLALNVCYMAAFFYLEKHLKDVSFGINETDDPFIHLQQVVLMGIALIIAFWYNIICYKEVRGLLGGTSRDA